MAKLIDDPIFCAVFSVVLITICRTVIRRQMRGGSSDPTTILLFNNTAAALLLLPFTALPEFLQLEYRTWALMAFSSAMWVAAQVCDIRSHKYLDLAVNAIFSTARYLVLTAVGVIGFGERFGPTSAVGVLLIVCSMVWNVERGQLQFQRGVLFKMVSVCATTLALSTDKYLTTMLDPGSVALLSFAGPSLFYLFTAPQKLACVIPEIRASRGWLLVVPLTLSSYYYFFTRAMGQGDLAVTIAISQTSTVTSFLAGYALLNERSAARRRAVGSLLCLLGAYLVSAF